MSGLGSSLMRALYTLAWWFAPPFIMLYLLRRARLQPAYRQHWKERFGRAYPARPAGRLIWIHAVSVGETRAAQSLIAALQRAYPAAVLLLTHITPTGRETSAQLYGDSVLRCYLPYDYPHAVRHFLRHFQPAIGILMETEIWPNLLREAARQQVPMVLANARMSARSATRGQHYRQSQIRCDPAR
jgi:3-deoxy-D-manno-octulosonic-acid transferase